MNNFSSPYGCPNNSGVPGKQYTAYGGSAQSNQYNSRYANSEYAQNQYTQSRCSSQYVNNGYNQAPYSSQYVNNEYNQAPCSSQYVNNGYNQAQCSSQYVNNGYNQAPCSSQYMNNGYNQSQCSNNQHNCSQYFGGQSANNQYSAAAVGAAPQPMQLNRSYTNTPACTDKKQPVVKQRKSLRKTSNRVGGGMLLFIVFTTVISMILMAMTVTSGSSSLNLSTVMLYVINAIASLVGEFIAAAIIMAMCKTNINKAVKIKSVSIGDAVKYTLAAMGFAYVFNLLLSFMNINLSMFGFQNKTSLDYGSTSGTVENIIYFIAIAVVPPIIEEFLFRGAILGSLRKHGDALAIVVSAVMFGFAHSNFIQTPVTFLTGLVLAYLTVKTNSLIPAIIIHFVNNSSSVAFSLLSQLKLDEMIYSVIDFSIALVFVLSGLICTAMLIKKFGNKLFEFDSSPEDNPNGLTMAKRLRYVFTSPWMIIYTAVVLLLCIQSAALA